MIECKSDILMLIEPLYLRNYLLKQKNRLSVWDYVEIVTKAPVPLQKKYEILSRMQKWERDRAHQAMIQDCLEILEHAITCLSEPGNEKVYFLLIEMNSKKLEGAVPVLSHQDALSYIYENYLKDIKERSFIPGNQKGQMDFYFILERYRLVGTEYQQEYEYIMDSIGEVLYFRRIKNEGSKRAFCENKFRGGGMEFIPVPYQPGDILYVDCRPFLSPTFCLIYYVGDDRECCSVRCLYPEYGDIIGEGALKHGHFYSYDGGYHNAEFISPLFRAELYKGVLPEDYQFMKEISMKLVCNATPSEELDEFFNNNKKNFFIEPSFKIRDECPSTDSICIDGICKKSLYAFCSKFSLR